MVMIIILANLFYIIMIICFGSAFVQYSLLVPSVLGPIIHIN